MRLMNVDESMCCDEDCGEPARRPGSFAEDTPAQSNRLSFLQSPRLPLKLGREEDLARSSEPMEDSQRPPQLPKSLDYLGDWRHCLATENRLNVSRLSLGSSIGEQRLNLMDGVNAWAPNETLQPPIAEPRPLFLPAAEYENEGKEKRREQVAESAVSPSECATAPPISSVREESDQDQSEKENRDKNCEEDEDEEESSIPVPTSTGRSRKRCCNCKKSRCLKLYCECFATQEYCSGCNCVDCHNTVDHIEEKKVAMTRVNAKNPSGFLRRLPVITEPMVGCNCKRSSCQRNYCCCFKRGGKCGSLCKCTNCSNRDSSRLEAEMEDSSKLQDGE